jgi:hypothetical protein
MVLTLSTKWPLDTHISIIQSPILDFFNAMNSSLHFLHIYHLDFYLKKKSCLYNKNLKVPPCRNYFFIKIKMAFASFETLGLES